MQPLAPEPPNFEEKSTKRTPIARDAVVGVVALELSP